MTAIHHRGCIDNGKRSRILIIRDNQFCEATYNRQTGKVAVFGGSMWPKEIPEVFTTKPRSKYTVNTYIKDEIKDHFSKSFEPLTV